jgi:hypothetical protein
MLKLIEHIHAIHLDGDTTVSLETKVYRDTEWDEYSVKLFKNGIEQVLASYHTPDKQDALDTAQAMIN